MPDQEQLMMYAVRSDVVHGLIGLGLSDPERAERHWRWAMRYATDPDDARWELASLSTRTLLWLGDPTLPLDGLPDSYWHGLQALVASVARSGAAPLDVAVAADLDALFARNDVDPSLFPTAVSHRPDVAIAPPTYVDARVIDHDDALALADLYAATSSGEDDAVRDFLSSFHLPMLAPCDLWLFSPGLDVLQRRPGVEDPPPPR